jgi:hypothetical protein
MEDSLRKGCLGKDPCRHYSRQLGRCKLGYVNPKTIKGALWAAEHGLLKPCPRTVKGVAVIRRIRDKVGVSAINVHRQQQGG